MRRYFLTYCLMCVVLLIAALVFSSCELDLSPSINGTLTVEPNTGPVGTTFTVKYTGTDKRRITGYTWRLIESSSGIISTVGSGTTYTADRIGQTYAYAEVKSGHKGIRSNDFYVSGP